MARVCGRVGERERHNETKTPTHPSTHTHPPDKTWKVLEAAIHEINNHNASGLSFEELYRCVCGEKRRGKKRQNKAKAITSPFSHPPHHSNAYNMVINKLGGRLYDGLVDTVSAHLEGVAARLADASGDALLRSLKEAWDGHCKSMQMVRDILMVSLVVLGLRREGELRLTQK